MHAQPSTKSHYKIRSLRHQSRHLNCLEIPSSFRLPPHAHPPNNPTFRSSPTLLPAVPLTSLVFSMYTSNASLKSLAVKAFNFGRSCVLLLVVGPGAEDEEAACFEFTGALDGSEYRGSCSILRSWIILAIRVETEHETVSVKVSPSIASPPGECKKKPNNVPNSIISPTCVLATTPMSAATFFAICPAPGYLSR